MSQNCQQKITQGLREKQLFIWNKLSFCLVSQTDIADIIMHNIHDSLLMAISNDVTI